MIIESRVQRSKEDVVHLRVKTIADASRIIEVSSDSAQIGPFTAPGGAIA